MALHITITPKHFNCYSVKRFLRGTIILFPKSSLYKSNMASKFQVLDSDLLDLPPSCIEFWPNNPSWFVVGTYELDKEEEDSWVHVEKSSSEVVVNAEPFPHKEGVVTSAPLTLIDYSHDSHIFVEDTKIASNDSDGKSEPPSTLQKRNGSIMLYHLDGGSL